MEDMTTNAQLQFITWLITTATDKCQTIKEVDTDGNLIKW